MNALARWAWQALGVVLAVALVALGAAQLAVGQQPAGALAHYAGKYPFNKVRGASFLEDPLVRAAVRRVVRDKSVRDFLFNDNRVAPPIKWRGPLLMAHGCEPHNCAWHHATIYIDINGKAASVCYHHAETMGEGRSRLYTGRGVTMTAEECPPDMPNVPTS